MADRSDFHPSWYPLFDSLPEGEAEALVGAIREFRAMIKRKRDGER